MGAGAILDCSSTGLFDPVAEQDDQSRQKTPRSWFQAISPDHWLSQPQTWHPAGFAGCPAEVSL